MFPLLSAGLQKETEESRKTCMAIMKLRTLSQSLLFALTLLSAAWSWAAATGSTGTAERPQLKNYASSYQFLQALEDWNKAQATAKTIGNPAEASATAPESSQKSHIVPSIPAGIDPTSESAPPPIIVVGPESLDEAVSLAKDIHHPDYKEKVRYHRTTHLSFPLPSIDGSDMSQASVGNALTLSEVTGGDQNMSSEQLSELIDQERRRLTEKSGGTETSVKGLNSGATSLPPERRSVISVTSH